MKTWFFTHAAS